MVQVLCGWVIEISDKQSKAGVLFTNGQCWNRQRVVWKVIYQVDRMIVDAGVLG